MEIIVKKTQLFKA